jgi:hypothetical protein
VTDEEVNERDANKCVYKLYSNFFSLREQSFHSNSLF